VLTHNDEGWPLTVSWMDEVTGRPTKLDAAIVLGCMVKQLGQGTRPVTKSTTTTTTPAATKCPVATTISAAEAHTPGQDVPTPSHHQLVLDLETVIGSAVAALVAVGGTVAVLARKCRQWRHRAGKWRAALDASLQPEEDAGAAVVLEMEDVNPVEKPKGGEGTAAVLHA
jgi:hypothetical protein